jgi:hypothetical protein
MEILDRVGLAAGEVLNDSRVRAILGEMTIPFYPFPFYPLPILAAE